MLRDRMQNLSQGRGWRWIAPPADLCTDNAAMIAWVGVERLAAEMGVVDEGIRPRWPLDPDAATRFGSGKKGAKA